MTRVFYGYLDPGVESLPKQLVELVRHHKGVISSNNTSVEYFLIYSPCEGTVYYITTYKTGFKYIKRICTGGWVSTKSIPKDSHEDSVEWETALYSSSTEDERKWYIDFIELYNGVNTITGHPTD